MSSFNTNEIQAKKERVTRLCTELVDGMADAVDLLGPMTRIISQVDESGNHQGQYRITVERI
jgi:hypothetical protein